MNFGLFGSVVDDHFPLLCTHQEQQIYLEISQDQNQGCFKIRCEITRQNPLLKKTCTFCALQLLWKPIILLPWHLPL